MSIIKKLLSEMFVDENCLNKSIDSVRSLAVE